MTAIFHGDCRDVLPNLPAGLAHTCVTSPPYFGLRDYGVADQIGLEPSPEEFIAAMVEVFREVRRVLRDDGTLWLNLGDSYSRSVLKGGSGPHGKHDKIASFGNARARLADNARSGSSDGEVRRGDRPGLRAGGLADKQLLGIPWRVAFALQADGWYLRQDIIWAKPNPMPESVQDRCTKAHEYIFLLSKSPRYYFDAEAIKEMANRPEGAGNKTHKGKTAYASGDEKMRTKAGLTEIGPREYRNKRSVWTVTPQPFKGAHFATFPPALIEPCVLAGAPVGGLVLDPFFGAGTTGLVAQKHGRDCIGIELNPEYVTMAHDRLTTASKLSTKT